MSAFVCRLYIKLADKLPTYHHHCGYHHAADLLQHCKDAAASVKDTRIGMPGGSGKLLGIFFAKGGRQEPGMTGDFQKISEMKRKNAEEQG